jgi:hypothetical protein
MIISRIVIVSVVIVVTESIVMIMAIPAPIIVSPSVSEVKIEYKRCETAIIIKRIITPVIIYPEIRIVSIIIIITKIKS